MSVSVNTATVFVPIINILHVLSHLLSLPHTNYTNINPPSLSSVRLPPLLTLISRSNQKHSEWVQRGNQKPSRPPLLSLCRRPCVSHRCWTSSIVSTLVYFREHKEAYLKTLSPRGGNVELHADSFVSPSMYNLNLRS